MGIGRSSIGNAPQAINEEVREGIKEWREMDHTESNWIKAVLNGFWMDAGERR
jgi:hypothetical protein